MKQIFLAIQQQLLTVPALKHIDKNWNQLNYEQPPVRWPCALIDIANADKTVIPVMIFFIITPSFICLL